MNNKDLAMILETVCFLASGKAIVKRYPLNEHSNSYPLATTEKDGRMMDYGSQKSDSQEGRMTKAKLFRMAQMAQRLHDKLEDGDDLPGWVQDKVTTAEDRLQSAHDYMLYKLWRMNNGEG